MIVIKIPQYSGKSVHPTESTPRLNPLPVEDMQSNWLETLGRIPGAGLKGEGFPRNVLGMLMYNPQTFGPFLEYWVTCKLKMGLSVREQELVILRMACLYRSNYVWKHHVPVGKEFGINEVELDQLRAGNYDSFDLREKALLSLTDEMVESRTIETEGWQKHSVAIRSEDLVDLIGLVSQYVLFSLMNNVMQVQVEPALVAIPGIERS